MRSKILSLTALLLPAALCGTADADESIDAERIYQESCSVCHGDDGRGAVWGQASLSVPPRNFRTVESRQELTRERMIASVIAGRPGTPMPGFGTQLSIPEVMAVVDWVRGEFMTPEESRPASPQGPRLPGNTEYGPIGQPQAQQVLPEDFAGDPGSGALLYAENCVACHGANGGGDGPRAYFIFPKPRNFHDPSTREYLSRRNLYNGIKFGVVGKEMPAWGKVLSDGQIADLTEYVYRQFIVSESTD
ncbi:MAG TPA: c-type cytochrome [Woeseiaceae bacterium]|jgi:mono/diheme cytochrome c family protein